MTNFHSRSGSETVSLGKSFAATLRPGDVVALFGNLGTGKTQFVKGVCEGLMVSAHTGSPTFTFIHEYTAPFGTVAHVDLYRVNMPEDLVELGVQEYFNDRCITLIEWAENGLVLLPPRRFEVRFHYGASDTEREILIDRIGSGGS